MGYYMVLSGEKTKPIKAKLRQDDGFGCGRIEIAAVAALLRNDISGLFEKTKPILGKGKSKKAKGKMKVNPEFLWWAT